MSSVRDFNTADTREYWRDLPRLAMRISDRQIVSETLKKLNALSEKMCAERTSTTKRRKLTERDHSIKTGLAKAKEQTKQPTAAEGDQNRAEGIENNTLPAMKICGLLLLGIMSATTGFLFENSKIKKWNPAKANYRTNKVSIISLLICAIMYGLMCAV